MSDPFLVAPSASMRVTTAFVVPAPRPPITALPGDLVRGSRLPVGLTTWILTAALCCTLQSNWLMHAFVAWTLLWLPGAVVLTVCSLRPAGLTSRVIASVGLSLVVVMAVGSIVSALAPFVGTDRPLDRPAQLVIWSAISVTAIALCGWRRVDPVLFVLGDLQPGHLGWCVAFSVLPAAAVVGALRLNAGRSGAVALGVGVVAITVLLALTVVGSIRELGRAPMVVLVFAVAVTVVLSTSLRGGHLFGWDIQQEYGVASATIRAGRWTIPGNGDSYASMLSLTVLPAQLLAVAGLSAQTTLRVVFPILFALTAAATYVGIRRHARAGVALGVTAVFIFGARSFGRQMPAIGRQEIGLLLFAVLVLVAFDGSVSIKRRRAFVIVMTTGIAVAHYSTAYATVGIMLIGWLAHSALTIRRREERSVTVLNTAVVLGALIGTIGWNFGVTRAGANLQSVSEKVAGQGAGLLPNSGGSLLQTWLLGTSAQSVDAATYAHGLQAELLTSLAWVQPSRLADDVTLHDASAPVIAGLVPAAGPIWRDGTAAAFQIVLLVSAGGLLLLVIRWRRRTDSESGSGSGDLLALGIGAISLAVVLRLSGSVSQFYNPERGALHASMVLAIPAAMLIEAMAGRRRWTTMLATTAVAATTLAVTWGLGAYLVGGGPPAAYSNTGEDVERFVVGQAELQTARWLASNVGTGGLVQSDRYGTLALLDVAPQASFSNVPVIAPDGVSRFAYVYASVTNTELGRARASLESGHLQTTYAFPRAFYDDTRAVVYATEVTRVYR